MKWFFVDGNLTFWGGVSLALIGTCTVIGSIAFATSKFLFLLGVLVGVLFLGIASASLKSLVLGIKPFTNDPLGWRKAKKSYETKEDSDNAPKKGDLS